MISQIDQECADAIAALQRWLALRLQNIIASKPPPPNSHTDELAPMQADLQTALSLMHVYQEALKLAIIQRANSNPARNL